MKATTKKKKHNKKDSIRAEDSLSSSILDSLTAPFFMIDYATRKFLRWNKAFFMASGYSHEEIAHMEPFDLVPASEHDRLIRMAKEFIKKGFVSFEMPVLSRDGTSTSYLLSGNRLVHEEKIYVVGMGIDITEHKKSEELLKQRESQYRLLADNMKDYVWMMDLNLNIRYMSPSAIKIMGYTLEEFKQSTFDKFLTPESFQKAMDFYAVEMPKALSAPPDYVLMKSLELEFCCKDSQTVWGEVNFSLIKDEYGRPLSLVCVSRNITERKHIENELRASESNFRHSLDDSPLGVRISTRESETIYANRAILDIYGYDSIEELKNKSVKERYTPESYAEWQARREKREKGEFGPSEYEISIVTKTGEIRHLYVFRKEIFWDGKKQYQIIYQDITLRRQAEEKLSATMRNLRQSIKTTIQVLGMASEAKDPYTAGHQKKVSNLARAIATELGLPNDMIEGVRMAGSIHDIGKLSVPGDILSKPTKLTDLEFSLVKEHAQSGYALLKHVESPWPLAEIVLQHHERVNGLGYPHNLKGNDILITARIMAVADVVEAMSSHRPYRPSLGIASALAEIENNRGTLYDEDVVNACLRLFREKSYQLR